MSIALTTYSSTAAAAMPTGEPADRSRLAQICVPGDDRALTERCAP